MVGRSHNRQQRSSGRTCQAADAAITARSSFCLGLLGEALSPGLEPFADKIRSRGIPVTLASHTSVAARADDAAAAYRAGNQGSIVVVGHSLGATAAMAVRPHAAGAEDSGPPDRFDRRDNRPRRAGQRGGCHQLLSIRQHVEGTGQRRRRLPRHDQQHRLAEIRRYQPLQHGARHAAASRDDESDRFSGQSAPRTVQQHGAKRAVDGARSATRRQLTNIGSQPSVLEESANARDHAG